MFVSHAEIGGSGGHVEIEPLGADLKIGGYGSHAEREGCGGKAVDRRLCRIPKMDTVKILLI